MSDDYIAIPLGETDPEDPSRAPLLPPAGMGVRGFGIYVGVDDTVAHAAGIDVAELVDDVQRALTGIPGTRTFASVVLAPGSASAPSLQVVRAALSEPSLGRAAPDPAVGVVVDLARHHVSVDGRPVPLRYREQALLDYLVRRRGEVLDRPTLRSALLAAGAGEVFDRTIDVYLQRLRRRLDPYGDIVRTVRGRGYRIDPHPDLHVLDASLPG